MLFSLTTAILSLSAITSSFASADDLKARDVIVGPSAAFQIYSASPDRTMSLGGAAGTNSTGNSTRRFHPRNVAPRGIAFNFHVSKNGSSSEDLVVSFENLPCPPASYGAYSFEFNFVPEAQYKSSGEGQINMFKINGDIASNPTYNNIEAITGSLIGTFELPTGADANQPKLIFINQLVCEPTINLRFGITQYSAGSGAVMYMSRDGMGLRERSGE